MDYIALGKSNLLVSRTAFGAMSLDCDEIEAFGDEAEEKACALVRQAYDSGVNFFDTSCETPVCERRLGAALHGIRQNVILATKAKITTPAQMEKQLEESLSSLESDFVDLFQIETSSFVPLADDVIYQFLCSLKDKGLVKHLGLVTDSVDVASSCVSTGLYETVQFPFNILTGGESVAVVDQCHKNDVGCIAMQPLNGGLVNNIPLALGYLLQYENVIPLWGVHTQDELQQILYFNDHPPVVDDKFKEEVLRMRSFFN